METITQYWIGFKVINLLPSYIWLIWGYSTVHEYLIDAHRSYKVIVRVLSCFMVTVHSTLILITIEYLYKHT